MKAIKFISVILFILAGLSAGALVFIIPGVKWYHFVLMFIFSEIVIRPAFWYWMAYFKNKGGLK